jgi:hypothetical protein
MFRFVGLSFLVPGVMSPALSTSFAAPAAYGDQIAAVLAIVAILAVTARVAWAAALVWLSTFGVPAIYFTRFNRYSPDELWNGVDDSRRQGSPEASRWAAQCFRRSSGPERRLIPRSGHFS